MAQMDLGWVCSAGADEYRSSTYLVGGSSVQLGGGSENRMIAGPQQQPHAKDRSKGERSRDEKAVDEALKNTSRRPIRFPFSSQLAHENLSRLQRRWGR